MSEFTFACPLCREEIRCGAQYYGQPLQCPVCHGEITAPEAQASPAGSLGIKKPAGEKHAPVLPRFQKQAVAPKKSGLGKGLAVTAAILVILAALFFTVRFTGLSNHLPSYLGGRTPVPAEPAATVAETVATAPAPPTPPPPAVWTTNLAEVSIPTNAVYGRISTNEFKYDSVRVDNGILAFRLGKDAAPDLELGIFFGLKAGENLSGKSLTIAPETRAAPRVWKKWKVVGKPALQQKVYSKGYAMKLQFGEVSEDKVPGKIFLSLPDEDQSVVTGSFVATVGAAIAVQPAAQTVTPASPQMSEQMRNRYGVRAPARP